MQRSSYNTDHADHTDCAVVPQIPPATMPVGDGDSQNPTNGTPIEEFFDNFVDKFQALGMARDWLLESGPENQEFGPEQPITQDLMRDEGVAEARSNFMTTGEDSYPYGFGLDDYIRETFQAVTLQDITGSVLGCYIVDVFDNGDGTANFVVSNVTGWESGTRNPTAGNSQSSLEGILFRGQPLNNPKSLLEDRTRAEDGPDGNLIQRYMWTERLYSSGFR